MIPVRGFEGKRVAVFGLGRTGLTAARALIAGGAPAQTLPLPATELQPTDGIGVATGPDGMQLDVNAGENGGVTLDAGPGGVNLGARRPRSAS